MRKRYLFAVGILLFFIAVWGIYKVTLHHRNTAGEQAVATLSAKNLYDEFQTSENVANKKWVGKVIEVSGSISSVIESGNYISIDLRASVDGGVNCSLLKKDLDPGNNFKPGDSITIKGKCTGFLMDVNLVDCVVKK